MRNMNDLITLSVLRNVSTVTIVHTVVARSSRQFIPFHNTHEWVRAECGGGGDCLFHSCGVALGVKQQDVRRMIADAINASNVDRLVHYYNTSYRVGSWDREAIIHTPQLHDRVAKMRAVVHTSGPTYMGDDTTLRLLVSDCSNVGFLVLFMNGDVSPQVYMSKYTRRLVVLLYLPGHWQIVGQVVGSDVRLTFDPYTLPLWLTERLSRLNIDVQRDFADWNPRLELDGVHA